MHIHIPPLLGYLTDYHGNYMGYIYWPFPHSILSLSRSFFPVSSCYKLFCPFRFHCQVEKCIWAKHTGLQLSCINISIRLSDQKKENKLKCIYAFCSPKLYAESFPFSPFLQVFRAHKSRFKKWMIIPVEAGAVGWSAFVVWRVD